MAENDFSPITTDQLEKRSSEIIETVLVGEDRLIRRVNKRIDALNRRIDGLVKRIKKLENR